MDWRDSKKPLIQLSVFAFTLAFLGASYWIYIAFVYIGYSLLMTQYLYRVYATLPRDISGLILLLRVKWNVRKRLKANRPLHEIFLENVHRTPNKEAIVEVSTDRRFTFEQFNAFANQYAHFFQKTVNTSSSFEKAKTSNERSPVCFFVQKGTKDH
ncbi:unnamed protein product [Toxocara canis]|uniref:Microsomal signal peptidase 25 kDa subunit n=1 Tax=Toxocara canis TaxID=6265 RepID=A0A183V702_TOXCA|nr:unnamed protein product [Toxocara canis]